MRRLHRRSEGVGDPTGQRAGGSDTDLLTQDGANCDFEAVECAGNSQTGAVRGKRTQSFGDAAGAAGKVQQMPNARQNGGYYLGERG
jgi:hypothetical protein